MTLSVANTNIECTSGYPMTPREIEMCVLDCLQDDDIEDIAALLRLLSGADDDQSWETARGMPFSEIEVQSALARLMEKELVKPLAEQAPHFGAARPIPREGHLNNREHALYE